MSPLEPAPHRSMVRAELRAAALGLALILAGLALIATGHRLHKALKD